MCGQSLSRLAIALVAASLLVGAGGSVAGSQEALQVPQDLQDNYDALRNWVQAGIDAWDFGSDGDTSLRPRPLSETFSLGLGRFGRCLVAAGDFQAGETVMLLPLNRLMYMKDYGVGLEGLMPNQQAAVWLARQRRAGDASPYAVYMAMLPDSHPYLPKHWDKDFLLQHMQGSTFPSYIQTIRDSVRHDYEVSRTIAPDVSWEDFEWGHDTFQTRSVFWDSSWVSDSSAPRQRRSSALVPLFDLLMHEDYPNADFKFDTTVRAMRLTAKRNIHAGDEVTIPYFDPPGSRSNSEVLNKWGFASENALKMAEVTIIEPANESHDVPAYALEETAFDQAAEAFLANLRARADQRPIHLPDLPEGWLAIPDARTGWMYYWSQETGDVTWARPGIPDGAARPYWTPATTWRVEMEALKEAKAIMERHLAKFKEPLSADQAMLAGEIADVRVRFLTLVRRNEKQVLTWWSDLVDHALKHVPQDIDTAIGRDIAHFMPPSWYQRAHVGDSSAGTSLEIEGPERGGDSDEL